MEALLSLSFDNITSKDVTKIRKGLRQIEGLLAQICLAKDKATAQHRRKASTLQAAESEQSRTLCQVATDPAFREFFRLQEGFEWNVATKLISCVERLLGMPSNDLTNSLILSTLDLLQGVLLLHPPSRTLFRREIYMNVLLDLLDSANPPTVQSQALLALVSALLATPANTRTFENLDGLLTVASLFKSRNTSREVKMKVIEFFYFYLMPEIGSPKDNGLLRKPTKRVGSGDSDGRKNGQDTLTKTTEEKQRLLGRYMSNVAELVQDLQESAHFDIST